MAETRERIPGPTVMRTERRDLVERRRREGRTYPRR